METELIKYECDICQINCVVIVKNDNEPEFCLYDGYKFPRWKRDTPKEDNDDN